MARTPYWTRRGRQGRGRPEVSLRSASGEDAALDTPRTARARTPQSVLSKTAGGEDAGHSAKDGKWRGRRTGCRGRQVAWTLPQGVPRTAQMRTAVRKVRPRATRCEKVAQPLRTRPRRAPSAPDPRQGGRWATPAINYMTIRRLAIIRFSRFFSFRFNYSTLCKETLLTFSRPQALILSKKANLYVVFI